MLNVGGGIMVSALSSSSGTSGGLHNSSSLTLSMEKLLHYASSTGDLNLAGRNLKEFPKHCCKYQLKDTTSADLSRNKLTELPQECTDYFLLERLLLYNNTIRNIPESIVYMQSLQFLDLSRNQLSYLPAALCELPLQALVLNNNRLVSLPEEIGKMQTLMELDASCNEIAHLPVQIGDLASLKSLNLRRNHLQEVPVEISYLQLTFLDLSGNRISQLPVELRFMTSVIELNLGENPLTCPPANLVSRGRIHVFKYLEIQAIKEDRKRGVLTDSEYRRSYRKTTQLNDFRFGSGFGADARRKRHTADSGYGSEQPLDRRWSQEFGHENGDISTTEEARRLILRAANCPRSPRGLNGLTTATFQPRGGMATAASAAMPPPLPPPPVPPMSNHNHPLTSAGSSSSSASSSGYSSMHDQLLRVAPPSSSSGSSASCSPTGGVSEPPLTLQYNGINNGFRERVIKENPVKSGTPQTGLSNGSPPTTNGKPVVEDIPKQTSGQVISGQMTSGSGGNESPDDQEKEERRRAAQKVFGKQGSGDVGVLQAPAGNRIPACTKSPSNRHAQPLPIPPVATNFTKPLPPPQHGSTNSLLPVPLTHPSNSSNLLANNNHHKQLQQAQSYRQYREHLRQQRQQQPPTSRLGYVGLNGSAPAINGSSSSVLSSTSELSQTLSEKLHINNTTTATSNNSSVTTSEMNAVNNDVNNRYKSYDMKAMQKEAVLSYVKSKQSSPARSVSSSSHSEYSVSSTRNYFQHHSTSTSTANGRMITSTGPPSNSSTTTTTSIPLPSNSSTSSSSSVASSTNGLKYVGKLPVSQSASHQKLPQPVTFTARRDAEKSASADAHINQLRMQIETRLRISLPEDLSVALVDGVILCHIANHVKPRAVPSIHVPSPAVPKLTPAKCRRNVENFLLACRRIGVREDLICSPADILEPRKKGTVRVAISVSEVLRFHQPKEPKQIQ